MMRSFRPELLVSDVYGAFLKETGADHPMRESDRVEEDWVKIAKRWRGIRPTVPRIEKQMAHRMVGRPDDIRNVTSPRSTTHGVLPN